MSFVTCSVAFVSPFCVILLFLFTCFLFCLFFVFTCFLFLLVLFFCLFFFYCSFLLFFFLLFFFWLFFVCSFFKFLSLSSWYTLIFNDSFQYVITEGMIQHLNIEKPINIVMTAQHNLHLQMCWSHVLIILFLYTCPYDCF